MATGKQFEIDKRETFEQGIIRLLVQLNTDISRQIVSGSRVHISIHEARKNIKKIRSILRLVRHEIGEEIYHELNTFYRESGQQVAQLRDDTSIIELLEGSKKRIKSGDLQLAIQKSIRLTKKKRETEFIEFHKNKTDIQLSKAFDEKAKVLSRLQISGNPEIFIMKSLNKIYINTTKRMKLAEAEGTNEAYHNWRKQVKYLMFQMMLLKNAWPNFFNAYIIELGNLQKLLGNLHDLDILNSLVVKGDLLPLNKNQKGILLKYIYPRRASLKKQVHTIGNLLFTESSPAFSKRLLGIWMNSGFKIT
jgi:CHAD domain-containing protein